MKRFPIHLAAVAILVFQSFSLPALLNAEDRVDLLAAQCKPWVDCWTGADSAFQIDAKGSIPIGGHLQEVVASLVRWEDGAYRFRAEHPEYAMELWRTESKTALLLPKHRVALIGSGATDAKDHMAAAGLVRRLISPGTSVSTYLPIAMSIDAQPLAEILAGLLATPQDNAMPYRIDSVQWRFEPNRLVGSIDGQPIELQLSEPAQTSSDIVVPEGWRVEEMERADLERHFARGIRRALEVLSPSKLLTEPKMEERLVDHGKLIWIDGQRVALLSGTPEQIGTAHGALLKEEAYRCIDSVVYAFGTAQTIANGRWFPKDLEAAYKRLEAHIPERHKVETRALAKSLDLDPDLMEVVNVFPELFHCSGFALFGDATEGGKLYHGRVLDYMTAIGLQDCATTFIMAPEGQIPFANIGYAGFIGSVSGMNAEKISLGEMGGRGEGKWDGVPMATLMRRALEECSSLDQVKKLWADSPRTCEYYYVFADGEEKSAVGVAATPELIQFVQPGQGHELLGEGIPDAVILSAGDRLTLLRKRVQEKYGKIDVEGAKDLMCRPVAMDSNLHNVLFVPEDGVFYVANADHQSPAADRPYARIDLQELLRQLPENSKKIEVSVNQRWDAIDSLRPGDEGKEDAKVCLDGLVWQPGPFEVALEKSEPGKGDWVVRYPSPLPIGNEANDRVAMEWYAVKDKQGNVAVAPAAVVVHESGSGMTVGRLIAQGLRAQGVHAFMVQLPHYGLRRTAEGRGSGEQIVRAMQQGIGDVRRAKDAVTVLPGVDAGRISLQGTSLGGFVAATVAGLDRGFHGTFILLAGGDLYSVMMQGKKDAAKMREEMLKAGIDAEKLKEMLNRIEPLRLAHRIDADRMWMFSGRFDDVVPPRNSDLLAAAAGLSEDHHHRMMADHYSGIVFLPYVLEQMSDLMRKP